jgi:plasmid replication initiation protein
MDYAMNFLDEEIPAKKIRPNAILKQDNRIVNGRWKMNLNQSRIFLTAMSMIEDGDKEFEAYRIKGSDLKKLLDLKGNSIYEQLSKDVPKLMTTYVSIEHEKGNDKEWFSLVSSARYKNGDLFLKFDNSMKPYLLNLKSKFTQCKLDDAMKFKSMYSLRLFLMLKQFDSTGWRHMAVDELRDSLNLNATKENHLKKDMYKMVNDLKKRVLLPAVAELNKTGFKVELQELKEGRKITAFKFTWANSSLLQKPQKVQFNPKDESSERLLNNLKDLKLSDPQIKYIGSMIGTTYTLQELYQFLYGLRLNMKDKKVSPDKVGGYVYAAFKNRYKFTF